MSFFGGGRPQEPQGPDPVYAAKLEMEMYTGRFLAVVTYQLPCRSSLTDPVLPLQLLYCSVLDPLVDIGRISTASCTRLFD